TIESVYF
ncbi:CPXV054 protein, partial [Monkeypox virus]